jgi:Integrase core domain
MLTTRPDRVSCPDNAWAYTGSRAVRELLARSHIDHLTTEPYRPRTNGKVERFHQTMAREWAYGLVYRSHRERARTLPHWLHHYNTTRPHSSLGGRAPFSRVHNLCGRDSCASFRDPRLRARSGGRRGRTSRDPARAARSGGSAGLGPATSRAFRGEGHPSGAGIRA